MVSFIRKRLQVFVSSTFTDLIQERQAAVEAILSAGHIPAGMELFAAGDESQMEVIRQWIDESDVYLLILGGRYGSVEPKTGKSYTQLEYEYALSRPKPLFACVITDTALEDRTKLNGRSVLELENPQKLKEFRSEVLTRMVKFWSDHKDIKIAVGETLSYFARRDELVGWVRANQDGNIPAIADAMARLSKENEDLRNKLKSPEKELVNGLSYSQIRSALLRPDLKEFIRKSRQSFIEGMRLTPLVAELEILGIMERRLGSDLRGMTSVGQNILSRFMVEDLNEPPASSASS
jgi:acylphosphatase